MHYHKRLEVLRCRKDQRAMGGLHGCALPQVCGKIGDVCLTMMEN